MMGSVDWEGHELWERQEHFSASILLVWGNILSWKRAEVRKGTEERQKTQICRLI